MYQIVAYTVIALLSVTALYPIYYIVAISLTSEVEWIRNNGVFLFPRESTLRAYQQLFNQTPQFVTSFRVSVLRTIAGTAFTLFWTLLTGYIVSRKDMPFRKAIMTMVLITILFNGGLIPTFLVIRDTGLYDRFLVFIIPAMVASWSVLIFKQFFENIPGEIEESAYMDGVGVINMLVRIILPMSVPVIAALGLFAAVEQWNSWFDALIYVKSEDLKPLQLLLRQLLDNANLGWEMNTRSNVLDPSQRVSTISLRMAVAVVGIVPILCVYPFLQKYFSKGVYLGAVKG